MGLVIRLRRHGSRKKPFFRIVVADSRSPRDGRFVAQIGTYNPAAQSAKVSLEKEETERWLKAGAKPSDTVRNLIRQAWGVSLMDFWLEPLHQFYLNGADYEGASAVPRAAVG